MRTSAVTRKAVAVGREPAANIAIEKRLSLVQGNGSPKGPAHVHLTSRQLEVLALLCEGLPNKLICRRLNIAAGTAKAHISSILRELGVSSRLQAVVAARRLGLLDSREDEDPGDADSVDDDSEDVQDTLRSMGLSGRGTVN